MPIGYLSLMSNCIRHRSSSHYLSHFRTYCKNVVDQNDKQVLRGVTTEPLRRLTSSYVVLSLSARDRKGSKLLRLALTLPLVLKSQHTSLHFLDDFMIFGKKDTKAADVTIQTLSPVLKKVLMLTLLSDLLPIVAGRTSQLYWQSLPYSRRQYLRNAAKKCYWKIASLMSLIIGLIVMYYYRNLQEAPYTKRKRFVGFKIFTPEQLQEITDYHIQRDLEKHRSSLLPAEHPTFKRVNLVAKTLLEANADIKELSDKNWTIFVIDNIPNCFVSFSGQIFISTRLVKLFSNDDQLGFVLGHELAHGIVEHNEEMISLGLFYNALAVFVKTAIWAFMHSILISFVSHLLFEAIGQVLFILPLSRKQEVEADETALQLVAKACFDVRESSVFWWKIEKAVRDHKIPRDVRRDIEWLSTHPKNVTRMKYLDSIMDKYIDVRKSYGCLPLTDQDPRSGIMQFKKIKDDVTLMN